MVKQEKPDSTQLWIRLKVSEQRNLKVIAEHLGTPPRTLVATWVRSQMEDWMKLNPDWFEEE
jgi:hypothetical protein